MAAGTTFVAPTGNQDIDGLLEGMRWNTSTLTYSFPTSSSYYVSYGTGENTNNFQALTATQQATAQYVLSVYASIINVTFTQVTESSTVHADLRLAQSNSPTIAYAYYPDPSPVGGDAWFHTGLSSVANPDTGNYAYETFMHELGHALGLAHGHEGGNYGPMTATHDSMEYSIMTYRSYEGAAIGGYTNEAWGYAQTPMMYDIAALQTMYGANFNSNSGSTTYTWDASTGQMSVNGVGQDTPGGNRVFMTVWDGGGVDTYDFSNYTTNLTVSLKPGEWTTASAAQLAQLGASVYADGNIANSLLYNGDVRSLIENATGGSGSDTLVGNIASNYLKGNGGNDALDGQQGNDTLDGGTGTDTLVGGSGNDCFVYSNGYGADTINDFACGVDRIDLTSLTAAATFAGLLTFASQVDATTVIFNFGGGNTLTLLNVQLANMSAGNFIFGASSNQAPVITSNGGGSSAGISVVENATAVTTVTGSDANAGQSLAYSISGGADAAKFTINASTGALSFVTAPNFEAPTDTGANNVYDLVVQVADGAGGTDTQALAVTVTNVNEAPVITSNGGGSTASISVAKNTTAVTTVVAADPDAGQPLTYAITGGADAVKFTVNASTGALSFVTAPNFEAPTDVGADNVYNVTVRASDNLGLTTTQALAVTVTNVNEAPVITSNGGGNSASISIAENTTAVTTVVATDPDAGQTRNFSIVGGADAARFAINASTGALAFVLAPNFEVPTDTGANNVYDVVVQVADGAGGIDTQAVAVTVTNANEAPVITSNGGGSSATISVAENTTAVTTVAATEPDAGQTLAYSIISGADAALFTINASTGALAFITAPNFEVPTDAGGNNVYDVVVRVGDGVGGIDTQNLAIGITDVSEPAVVYDSGRSHYHVKMNISGNQHTVVNTTTGASQASAGFEATQFADGVLDPRNDTFRFNDDIPALSSDRKIVAMGDFNGDQTADLIWQNDKGELGSWIMKDGKVHQTIALNHDMPGWKVVATGDFNHDGTTDLMWKNAAGVLGTWIMNNGAIGSSFAMNHDMPGWDVVATGDFNNDGTTDLLWKNEKGVLGTWLMQDGKIGGTFAMNHDMPGWSVVATGDFNNDGTADVMWKNEKGVLGTWLMQDGKIGGTFAMNHDMPGWTVSATGDFDHNGTTDIMWNNGQGTSGVWLMQDGIIGATFGFNTAGWTAIGQGDFDQNGFGDILWHDAKGELSTWLLA